MKALIYRGSHVLEFSDAADPVPQPDEVLVAVEAVGICGSDMHAWHGHDERRPAPLILGHEAAGRIVTGPRKGERVTINPLVTCGRCDACVSGRSNVCAARQIISMPPREGAFAQLVRIPERNVVTIPAGHAGREGCARRAGRSVVSCRCPRDARVASAAATGAVYSHRRRGDRPCRGFMSANVWCDVGRHRGIERGAACCD